MKYDRSQFKSKKIEEIQQQTKEIEDKAPKFSGGRAKVMRIPTDGKAVHIRIAPAHPLKGAFWCYPVSTSFLPIQRRDKDGELQEKDGRPDIGQKPLFTANHHAEGVDKDPVSVYMEFARKQAYDEHSGDDAKRFLNPIYGWKANGKYNGGISPSTKYMIYGWMDGVFGRIELSKSVRDKINDLAISFDPTKGVLATDPFTDPDTGVGLTISYDKDETNLSNKYKVNTVVAEIREAIPLTDKQFEEFAEQKPLMELYTNTYNTDTFAMILEGLQRFEKQSAEKLKANGFNNGEVYEVFTHDAFHDAIEALAADVPAPKAKAEEKDEDDKETPPTVTSSTSNEEETEEEEDDFVWEPEMIDSMGKTDLKDLVKESDLGIKFLPIHKIADMRNMVKKALGLEVPESVAPVVEEKKEAAEEGTSGISKLEQLKARMRG